MSITSSMYTGISGLLNNAEAMNVIGNNLANTNTIGFKGSRTLFSDMLSVNVGNTIGSGSQIGRGVQLQVVDSIFGQGSFETTDLVTDLAIQGSRFFALGKPSGNVQVTAQNDAYYTRAGAFRVDKDYYLVNPDGYQVLDTNGDPIRFQGAVPPAVPGAGDISKVTKIESNGLITYLDALGTTYFYTGSGTGALTSLGVPPGAQKVATVNAANPMAMEKVGGTLYKNAIGTGISTAAFSLAANTANSTTEKMFSNTLEQSNVDMATQFVKMILTQRAYSANSKTITTADEMTQEVLNLKR